jgi:hypothetical protein
VEDITFDSLGHVWFSSLEPASSLKNVLGPMWAYAKGVQEFDGTNWITYTQSNSGLVTDWVWDIAIDSLDHKWFAAWGGVSEFDGTSWTTYDTSNSGLAESYVYVMAIDPDGRKWFGYGWGEAGVSEFDGATWTTYNTSNSGLVSDWVTSIAIDSDGRKWFGTDSGVSEYIPDGVSGEVTTGEGGSITSSDGSVTLTFAPDAVSEDTDICFIPISPRPTGAMWDIGLFYELHGVAAGTSGPPVDTLAGTYTTTVRYTEDELGLADESTLALYYWDGSQWVEEPTSVVDTAANIVTATPNHFSRWAVLGERRTDLNTTYLPVVVKNN